MTSKALIRVHSSHADFTFQLITYIYRNSCSNIVLIDKWRQESALKGGRLGRFKQCGALGTGPQLCDTIARLRDVEYPSRSGAPLRHSWNSVTAEQGGSRADILLWGWHRYSYSSASESLYKSARLPLYDHSVWRFRSEGNIKMDGGITCQACFMANGPWTPKWCAQGQIPFLLNSRGNVFSEPLVNIARAPLRYVKRIYH
jgi:hypothetical protein